MHSMYTGVYAVKFGVVPQDSKIFNCSKKFRVVKKYARYVLNYIFVVETMLKGVFVEFSL